MFVDHYVIFASIGRPFQIFVPQKAHDNGRQKSQKVKIQKSASNKLFRIFIYIIDNISENEVIWMKILGGVVIFV